MNVFNRNDYDAERDLLAIAKFRVRKVVQK